MATNQDVLNSTNELLNRVQNEGVTGTSLGAGQYNASTGQITPMKPTTPVVPDLSSVNADTAGVNTLIENFFKQQAETAAANKTAAEATQANKPKSWKDWLTQSGNQAPQDFATQQYNALGFNPADYFNALKVDTAEIDSLNKDLTTTIAQRDQELNNISGRAIPMSEIIGSQAVANRNWNIRINEKEGNINSKAASMAAKQGNFTQAQNYVNKAVDAYTAQLKADLDMTMSFYDDNQDLIDSLGKDYSTAITNLISTKQADLTEKRRQYEWEEKMKLDKYQADTSRINANDGKTTTEDTFTDTVNYLKKLRDSGKLTDFSYREQINALMEVGGYTEDQRGQIESMVNKGMEGTLPQPITQNNEITTTPTTTKKPETFLGATLGTQEEARQELLNTLSQPSKKVSEFNKNLFGEQPPTGASKLISAISNFFSKK